MKWVWLALGLCALSPAPAFAWGAEGHEIVADIARAYLSPGALARLDQLLASETDTLTAPDMASRATWADAWRTTHKETSSWHFVDIELDAPNLTRACYDFPPSSPTAAQGPADDCLTAKITEFADELGDPRTSPQERILALNFILHFVGDLHQPLHAADNHDKGGNCVQVGLGGVRSTNLHSYWDTAVVRELGTSSDDVARRLLRKIKPADKSRWEQGDPKSWTMESYEIAKASVYVLGSRPGCDAAQGPISLPWGYAGRAKKVVALQLEKAGVRLALVLNRALGR